MRHEARTPSARLIAAGSGWCVTEFVCDAGPDDRAFEEQHDRVTIAAVLSGTFRYSTHSGTSLVHPGSFLLGAAGRCYECGHEHGRGDRCLSFSFAPDTFDEIAHGAAGAGRYAFGLPSLPAAAGLLPLAARIAALRTSDALAVEELAVRLAFATVTAASGRPAKQTPLPARDAKRIATAMRFIDEHSTEAINLDQLAAVAALSKFHFLRLFVRVAGVSPYRYLLNARLRQAAIAIADTDRRISDIACEAGFGDLSTFNALFKRVFAVSPVVWRREGKDFGA